MERTKISNEFNETSFSNLERNSRPGRAGRTFRALRRQAVWQSAQAAARIAKRTFDVVASSLLLLALSPLFSLIALLIRLESNGPIFFLQQRVGKYGRTFPIWKFRSMYVDAEARRAALENNRSMSDGVRFKMKKDPRITRVGRFIRKASIDELPQLWNVLKGDMSLVGPRPPIPKEVAEYSLVDRRRLDVVPGITCIWQVSGRADIPFEQQVEMDIDYIEQQSLRSDLALLLKTVPAVLFARGAY